MCGIVGYVGRGQRNAADVLLEGLHRLEYRGYDSAGVAVHEHGAFAIRKRVGRVSELERLLEEQPVAGSAGIGHTRWATHGGISDANSHPHVGGNGEVVVVHNGVIENYAALRDIPSALRRTPR
jgi:glutamine---fructose-6-phosphate transaminase (isomerizing)